MEGIRLYGYVPELPGCGQLVSSMTPHDGYPFTSPAIVDEIGTEFRRAVDRFDGDDNIPVVRSGEDYRKIDRMPRAGSETMLAEGRRVGIVVGDVRPLCDFVTPR